MKSRELVYFGSGLVLGLVPFLKVPALLSVPVWLAIPGVFTIAGAFTIGIVPAIRWIFGFARILIESRGSWVKSTQSQKKINENLMTACRDGHWKGMQEALQKGATVNYVDEEGNTPLHAACDSETEGLGEEEADRMAMGHKQIIIYLLSQGADPAKQNGRGFTPLHHAALQGFFPVFNFFKQQPFLYNLATPSNVTPLMEVMVSQKLSLATRNICITRLLKLGAEPNQQSTCLVRGCQYLTTPLGAAVLCYLLDFDLVLTDKRWFSMIELLVKNGATPMAHFHAYTSGSKKSNRSTILNLIANPSEYVNSYYLTLTNNQIASLTELFEKTSYAKISITELAKATTTQGIQAAVKVAVDLQKLTDSYDNACIELADAYFQIPQNSEGLQELLKNLRVVDIGYAHLHELFAHSYLDTLSGDLEPEQQDECRRLCLMHCLKGLASQERDSEHKIETMKSLNTLLSALLRDWQLEGLAPSNEGLVTDVFAYLAEILLNHAKTVAKAKQTVTGVQPSAPTALVAFTLASTQDNQNQPQRPQGLNIDPNPVSDPVQRSSMGL